MTQNNSAKIEHLTLAQVREVLREGHAKNEAARQQVQSEIDRLETKMDGLNKEREAFQASDLLLTSTIASITERISGLSGGKIPLAGNSLKEILLLNFADPEGVVKATESAKTLTHWGYFTDEHTAMASVYTVVRRAPFTKVDKGIYRFPTLSPIWARLRAVNGRQPSADGVMAPEAAVPVTKTKVVDVVAGILLNQPDLNRKQVAKLLHQYEWDFEGKNPHFVVSMAFAHLAKRRKAEAPRLAKLSQPS